MPTRADIESATPKCPKGEKANIPGAVCGEPLRWERWEQLAGGDIGRWVCAAHGPQFTGIEAARRAGFVPVWFADAAA